MRIFKVSILAFALSAAIASVAENKCPLKNPFKHFSASVQQADLEWYSAYSPDPESGNGNIFERRVKNLSHKLLKYDWPVGRMLNFGLPAGETDTLCIEYGFPNMKRGPLDYGRGVDQTPTQVWEGEGESQGGGISSVFAFHFEQGGDPEVVIKVSSWRLDNVIHYEVTNASRLTLRIVLQDEKGSDLLPDFHPGSPGQRTTPLPKISNYQKGGQPSSSGGTLFTRNVEDEMGIEDRVTGLIKRAGSLEPNETRSMNITSGARIAVMNDKIYIGSTSGQALGGAIIPVLVPVLK